MSAQSSSATRLRTTAVEPDEMVPSRYAQKVGAVDVLVISDGVLPIPARTIAHNIEPAVRTAWLEHEFLSWCGAAAEPSSLTLGLGWTRV